MNYEEMLEERKHSPTSRLVEVHTFFDDRDGRMTTNYGLIYKREDGLNFWQILTARTLSQMDVE